MYEFINDNTDFYAHAWDSEYSNTNCEIIDIFNKYLIFNISSHTPSDLIAPNNEVTHMRIKYSIPIKKLLLSDIISKFPNLQKIYIEGDIKCIVGCESNNLRFLSIMNCNLEDISMLITNKYDEIYFPNLRELILNGNNLTDIGKIYKLPNLLYLNVQRNYNLIIDNDELHYLGEKCKEVRIMYNTLINVDTSWPKSIIGP